ncbi:MAG: hypothetical protein GF375_00590, partial [Candidatus Omnitrophica bacterium]|nr:hypothetical protein [Candidatus Omnitrophota bacterium]MBD3268656.1 hypothetical protein [Candidatus Omnitrophota bacterium]
MIPILWKKKLLSEKLLYVLIDKGVLEDCGLDILSVTEKTASSECDLIQLRAKDINDKDFMHLASKLRKITKKKGKLLIINDRADIAYLSKSDGLHLGNNDIPLDKARKLMGKRALIGATIHSLRDFKTLSGKDYDYLSAGPFFETGTKPGLDPINRGDLKKIIATCRKLLFAVGG